MAFVFRADLVSENFSHSVERRCERAPSHNDEPSSLLGIIDAQLVGIGYILFSCGGSALRLVQLLEIPRLPKGY